jgi:hypothetical protein
MSWQWVCLCICFPGLLMGQPEYEINGQVLDAQTQEPVARATVMAAVPGPDGKPNQLVILTSSAGTFSIRNVPAGGAQLHCQRPGYLGGSSAQVSSMDGKPAKAVLYLTRQAVISGTVVDERGFAMLGAQVQAFRQFVVEGRRQFQQSGGAAADETGEFRVAGLAAGRYYLGFAAHARTQSQRLAYPPTLYPNNPDVSGARFIDLQPGHEERIEMRLTGQPAGEIRGSFPSGGGLGGISILPQRSDLMPMWLGLGASYDTRDNTFKIPDVPAGTYRLEGSATVNSRQVRASAVVTTSGGDVDGIVLTPLSEPALSGTVRVEGPASRPISSLTLKSPQFTQGAQVDADGAFRFQNPPADTYRVILPLAGSSFIRSISQGGRDVMRDGIAVGFGEPVAPIEIVVSPFGATIEGELKPPASEKPGPVIVALFRQAEDKMVLEKQAYSAIVDLASSAAKPALIQFSGGPPLYSPGRFVMEGVGPGDYILYAWRREAEIEYADSDYMRQFISYGQPVTVMEGGKVTVNVQHILSVPQP